MAKPDIVLIPWDPESPEHIARLIEQRVQCGWDAEKVDNSWVMQQKAGRKCIYWIVSRLYGPCIVRKGMAEFTLLSS